MVAIILKETFPSTTKSQRYKMKSVLLIVIVAFIIIEAITGATNFTTEVQAQVQATPPSTQCILSSSQPNDAIDMNTVIFESKVKTIHVEKEVFDCIAQTPLNQTLLKDVSIYSEITEDPTNRVLVRDITIYSEITEDISNITAVMDPQKTVSVITCSKDSNTGEVFGCEENVPQSAIPSTSSCVTIPVEFPVEMNTVIDENSGLVKTIESQKEVFECNEPFNTIKDLTTFTEVFESLSGNTQTPILKLFMTSSCVKDVTTANVIGCQFFGPKEIPVLP